MAWSRAFDDPITLPDGRVLKTLDDAGHYLAALPKATQQRVKRQAVAEILILAAAGMLAQIAMLRALHTTHRSILSHGQAMPKPRPTPAKKYSSLKSARPLFDHATNLRCLSILASRGSEHTPVDTAAPSVSFRNEKALAADGGYGSLCG